MAEFKTYEEMTKPKIEVIPAFVVPIFTMQVKNWETKKDKLLSLVDWENPEYTNDEQFSDYDADNCSPYMDAFREIMEEELTTFVSSQRISFSFQNVWAQRYRKQNYMRVHTHGSIGFSAVLFAEFDPNEHTATTFFGPVKNPITDVDQSFTPHVTEGTLLLFPKYLPHYVVPHVSEKDRTIFSFNLEPYID